MKALVTGGFGFIGSHLVEALAGCGHDVRIFDTNSDCYYPDPIYKAFIQENSVEVIKGDICEPGDCLNATRNIDVVFHTAAVALIRESYEAPERTYIVNVKGTENLCKAAVSNQVKKFIYSSTGKIYGNNGEPMSRETSPLIPITPYARTKYDAEKIVASYAKDRGIDICTMRYFSIYGPRMRLFGGLIGDILHSLLNGRNPRINATRSMARDFTYIDDVVRANLLCLERSFDDHEVFNIASGVTRTVEDLVSLIIKLYAQDLRVAYDGILEGMALTTQADITKAKEQLGYEPGVQLEDGLKRTIAWMKAYALLENNLIKG